MRMRERKFELGGVLYVSSLTTPFELRTPTVGLRATMRHGHLDWDCYDGWEWKGTIPRVRLFADPNHNLSHRRIILPGSVSEQEFRRWAKKKFDPERG